MGFVNPWLLVILPAAVVPLLLHLWMSRRVRVVELSTFRFLFDTYVQQRRRLRFLEALVAALRTLFLLALVMVVARPVVKHWSALFGGDLGREIVVLVDCSASMRAHTDGVPSLERAKSAARVIVEQMARGDRLTLVRVAGQPEELFSRFSLDTDKMMRQIENLEAAASRANLLGAFNLVAHEAAFGKRGLLVYFLTDCQASAWRDVRDQGLADLLPEGARLVVVDVGSGGNLSNQAVLGDAPPDYGAILGLPVILRARVANYAPTPISNLLLSVFIEEKEIGRVRLTLEPGQTAEREIVYVPKQEGVLKGRFELPPDSFPDDDSFLFTLEVAPQLKVLLVRPNPADPADPFQNEALYLRTALTTRVRDGAEPFGVALEPDLVQSLEVLEIAEPELDAEQLEGAGVVILANCGEISNEQGAALRAFVREGGGLLIFPGDRVKGATYDERLFAVPRRPDTALSTVKLGEPEGDPEQADTFERLAGIDFNHPVMSVFEDPDAQFLRTVQFFRRFALELPRRGGGASVLACFGGGAPALVESRFGDGMTMVAAFPANTRWTNLPMKPEFVPLVLRLVGRLARRPELEGPSVVAAGRPARIAVDPSWAPAKGIVVDGIGRETPLEFQWSGARLLGAFEGTNRKGYYTAEITGGEEGPEQRRGRVGFAVNLARDESDFRTVGENQLRDWLGSSDLSVVDASAQVQHLEGSVGAEREVWRPLIYLTFLIIAAEFLLSTSSGRRKAITRQSVADWIHGANPAAWVVRMTGGTEPTE